MSADNKLYKLLRRQRSVWSSHRRIGWVDSIHYQLKPMVEESNCVLILRKIYQYQYNTVYDGIYRKKFDGKYLDPDNVCKYPSEVGMVHSVQPVYDCVNQIIYFVTQDVSSKINYLHKLNVQTKMFELKIWKFSAEVKYISLTKNNELIYFNHIINSSEDILNYGILSLENMKHKSLQNEFIYMESLQNVIYLRHSHSVLIICNNSMIYRRKLKQIWKSTDSNKWLHIINLPQRKNRCGVIMDCEENILFLVGGSPNHETDDIFSINIQTKTIKKLYCKCPIVGSFYAITGHRVMENRISKLTFGFIRNTKFKNNLNIPDYLCNLMAKFGFECKIYLFLRNQSNFQRDAPNVWSVESIQTLLQDNDNA